MLAEPMTQTAPIDRAEWLARADRVAAAVAPLAAHHDETDTFVEAAYARLKAEGLFTALVPVEFGGGGATVGDICAVVRRLGATCGSSALAFAMHSHLVAVAEWRWRRRGDPTDGLLKQVAAKGLVLVSSGGGDWLPSGGEAIKVEGGFRVTARKPFSSGSPAGDLLSTSAVYEDPAEGPTVLHFSVPIRGEGVRIEETWKVLGMRGTGSNDIVLDGVFVPDAAVAGRRPRGQWHMLFHIISMIAFPIIYAAYVGVADGARARALEIARRRPQDEALPYLVGEMESAATEADLALERMIRIAETEMAGPEVTSRTMTCRTLAGRAAIATVERAMEVAGGGAFYRAAGLERAFRDVQGARFHPLQEKPQLRYTGRHALGWDIDR